jgi:glutamine synthetase
VAAKTKHNEVAPAQHELAPVFSSVNIAADHNQLTMELMKKVASRHGLEALLHEKPFANVNGSGKHNNWSLATDSGLNLLDPGDSPSHNDRFLLFLCAVIKAVDDYQDLLRISVASAGNDHRLGANEAPPAIISVFLGDELTAILEALEKKEDYEDAKRSFLEIGVNALPHFTRDSTDRNRTSPFAFTGNKFEFRMLGSSISISEPNTILNTIVAETLSQFADRLEKSEDFNKDLAHVIRKTIREHRRIIFNGNNYSEEWAEEAKARGLSNLRSAVEAFPRMLDEKNVDVLVKHRVYAEKEIHSRYEISLENYIKTLHIEALTLIDMAKQDIIPAVAAYENDLANLLSKKTKIAAKLEADFSTALEAKLLSKLSRLSECLYANLESFETTVMQAKENPDPLSTAKYYREKVFMDMVTLRGVVDELEALTAKKYWPYPIYAEMLYSV